jgi:hypothetical protein
MSPFGTAPGILAQECGIPDAPARAPNLEAGHPGGWIRAVRVRRTCNQSFNG